jgi:hypothetical protein
MSGSPPFFPSRRVLPIAACLLSIPLGAKPNSVGELDIVRGNLSQALTYRDQAAREQSAWELRRGQMENLVLLAEEETKNLEAVIELARPILDDLQSRRIEFTTASEASKGCAAFLRTAGPALGENLLEKSARWPDLLLLKVRGQLHEIEAFLARETDFVSDQDLEQLIRSAIEVLELALEFQNEIHLTSVLHTLPDGREANFEVLYLGLGAGYYLSDELGLAGRIVMIDGSWRWVARDDLLEPIRAFIEILQEERLDTWVQLPVGPTSGKEGAR